MMKRLSTLLALGAALALGLTACGGSAKPKDPNATLLAHVDAMIKILADNEANPDKATRELTAYEQKHGAEIERLKQELADLMQKDPMKASGVAAAYGLRSGELEGRKAEIAAKKAAQ
jgi:ABC-type glycerol-3-phosphate transport system substrate-binding protein